MPAKFFKSDLTLQAHLEAVLESTWETFPDLAQNQIALTWITYEPPYRINTGGALSAEEFWQYQPQGASYRGVELIEPGTSVHLFYLVAMHVWLEQGMAAPCAEIERAMAAMIQRGSHDATSYLLDVLSGTTSGPELPPGPMETWMSQRNIVNRYFSNLGWPELRSINLNQKTWEDGPYGRERDFLGKTFDHQNALTTNAIARLLHSIVGGVSVSSSRSQAMMALLAQQPLQRPSKQTPQTTPLALPEMTCLWQHTSLDATSTRAIAYVEAERVHPYLLSAFIDLPESKKIDLNQAKRQESAVEALVSFLSRNLFEAAQTYFKSTPVSS